MTLTFEQAQAEFQRIVRSITETSTPAELHNALVALDALTDQLRGRDGFDSLRTAIDEVYNSLVGSITAGVLRNLQLRDEIFKRASDGFAAINREADRSTKLVSLEKARLFLPALDQSVGEIKEIIAALQNNNVPDAVARGQSLLALIERVKTEVS